MSEDERVEAAASSTDERRRARLAELDAANEHGQQLLARYGREQPRQRFAVVGYADGKRRRRR